MTKTAKSPRLVSAVLLVLVLAAGFAIGVAWQSDEAQPPLEEVDARPSRNEERGRAAVGERMARERRALVIHEIGLDPETRAQVDEIISHFGSRMRALDREFRETYRPRQRALINETRDSIRAILTPRQVAVYDSLLALRYDRRGREGNRPPRDDEGRPHDDGGRSREDEGQPREDGGQPREDARGGR